MENHMEGFIGVFIDLLYNQRRLSIRPERSATREIRNVDHFIERLHQSNTVDVFTGFLRGYGGTTMVESIFATFVARSILVLC